MLITYDTTYIFLTTGMISVENKYEFVSEFIEMLIEIYTTGHPTMITIGAEKEAFHFIVGYNNSFLTHISMEGMILEQLDKEPYDIAQILLQQGQSYINYMDTPKKKKHIKKLLNELADIVKETQEIFVNYEIKRKTIDSLLYTHENKKGYCIIYDELDDLSETYRIITRAGSYVIYLSPISLEITPLATNLAIFTKDIYDSLKASDNTYIRTQNKKIRKYIEES